MVLLWVIAGYLIIGIILADRLIVINKKRNVIIGNFHKLRKRIFEKGLPIQFENLPSEQVGLGFTVEKITEITEDPIIQRASPEVKKFFAKIVVSLAVIVAWPRVIPDILQDRKSLQKLTLFYDQVSFLLDSLEKT